MSPLIEVEDRSPPEATAVLGFSRATPQSVVCRTARGGLSIFSQTNESWREVVEVPEALDDFQILETGIVGIRGRSLHRYDGQRWNRMALPFPVRGFHAQDLNDVVLVSGESGIWAFDGERVSRVQDRANAGEWSTAGRNWNGAGGNQDALWVVGTQQTHSCMGVRRDGAWNFSVGCGAHGLSLVKSFPSGTLIALGTGAWVLSPSVPDWTWFRAEGWPLDAAEVSGQVAVLGFDLTMAFMITTKDACSRFEFDGGRQHLKGVGAAPRLSSAGTVLMIRATRLFESSPLVR